MESTLAVISRGIDKNEYVYAFVLVYISIRSLPSTVARPSLSARAVLAWQLKEALPCRQAIPSIILLVEAESLGIMTNAITTLHMTRSRAAGANSPGHRNTLQEVLDVFATG